MGTMRKFAVGAALVMASAAATMAVDGPSVEGVFGLSRVTPETYLAAWVPLDEGTVVTGMRWYQNDGLTSFPEFLAMAGTIKWPLIVSAAVPLAQDVPGIGSSWNELVFAQPVTADSGGLYLVMHLPAESVFEYVGNGGGFGLGFMPGDGIRRGWVSGNGEDWNPVRPEHRLAVEPIVQANKSISTPLVLHLGATRSGGEVEPDDKPDAGMTMSPNPFNASTEIRFSLPLAGHAVLDVYDLHGRRVVRLMSEDLSAGAHSAEWSGIDESGRSVASGVYFAKLRSDSIEFSRSFVLLK